MFDNEVLSLASELLSSCRSQQLRLATAESCTGGLIGAALTAVAGSSDVVDRGFITYSNQSKCDLLGVGPADLERSGAVSDVVAGQMASGCLARSNAHISVAVTGVAGPGGGTAEKPVGLVYVSTASRNGVVTQRHLFAERSREDVRRVTVFAALKQMQQRASEINDEV